MRKYQLIWEAVKNSKYQRASVAAELSMHKRIIKAVTKEKSKDLGWKLLMAEQGKKYALMHDSDGKCIMFYLEDISHQLPIDINSL